MTYDGNNTMCVFSWRANYMLLMWTYITIMCQNGRKIVLLPLNKYPEPPKNAPPLAAPRHYVDDRVSTHRRFFLAVQTNVCRYAYVLPLTCARRANCIRTFFVAMQTISLDTQTAPCQYRDGNKFYARR